MQQETFNERVAQLQDLISEHVKQDPRPFYSYEVYEQSIPTLTSYVQESMDSIQQQLDGTLPSAGDGSGSGGGMGPGGGRGMRPGGETNGAGSFPPNDAPAGGISGGNRPANNDSAAPDSSDDASGSSTDVNSGKAEGDRDTALEGDEPSLSVVSSVGSSTSSSNEKTTVDAAPAVTTEPSPNAAELPEDQTQSSEQPPSDDNQPTMPQTPGQSGQSQMQDFPQGQMGNGFGGEFGGQMQGGRGMGRPGDGSNGAAEEQGSAKEALYAGVSIVLLLLSCLLVTLYKRKRL